MQVRVAVLGHVVVDNDVHALDVDAAAEQVRCDQNPFLELLELLVALDALVLRQPGVDGNRREVTLNEELVQSNGPLHGLHKDHDLIELQDVQTVVELPVLFLLGQLHEILQQTMQRELGFLVHADLMGIGHELLANGASLGGHGRTEHHHLLLPRRLDENLLDVLAHVKPVEALVALIQDELRKSVELQRLLAQQGQDAPGRANEDVGAAVLEQLPVLHNRHASIHDAHLQLPEVLREAVEFVLDLIRQLPRVAHDEHPHLGLLRVDLLEACEHEDGRLAHARLGLAKDVRAQDGLRDAFVLHLGGVLEAAIDDGPEQLRLQ
mmetsp:Transcript_69782/g.202250  ORF Transcript_69782/g.202250 Transcript_69782/m.202250 type:complete len:323 (+) Transcript_69782:332-1300(+)